MNFEDKHESPTKDVLVNEEIRSRSTRSTRRNLLDGFNKECPHSFPVEKKDERNINRSILSNITNLSSFDSRRAFRAGADKFSRTLGTVRTTFGSFSKHFRTSKKRKRLQEPSDQISCTPRTRSRNVLGRTPTKLYSPFGIDSPKHFARTKTNLDNSADEAQPLAIFNGHLTTRAQYPRSENDDLGLQGKVTSKKSTIPNKL